MQKSHPAKQRAATLVQAYKTVFRSEEGKIVLRDLLTKFHVLSSSMATGHVEFAEGERNVALYILDKLNTSVEDIDRLYGDIKASSGPIWGEE